MRPNRACAGFSLRDINWVLKPQTSFGSPIQDAPPSRTAQRVSIRRAEHQFLDQPRVFGDPLAVAIAARSRYAEDQLTPAVLQRGVRPYVVLGAGLDTFAYRNPLRASRLRVFEGDHPATQAWKRARLSAAGIAFDYAVERLFFDPPVRRSSGGGHLLSAQVS
ncbi:MAG: class I SAM-dependent methyltransferase [Bryobacteraceae bacterium]